jgi:hypothetical protein
MSMHLLSKLRISIGSSKRQDWFERARRPCCTFGAFPAFCKQKSSLIRCFLQYSGPPSTRIIFKRAQHNIELAHLMQNETCVYWQCVLSYHHTWTSHQFIVSTVVGTIFLCTSKDARTMITMQDYVSASFIFQFVFRDFTFVIDFNISLSLTFFSIRIDRSTRLHYWTTPRFISVLRPGKSRLYTWITKRLRATCRCNHPTACTWVYIKMKTFFAKVIVYW